MRLRTLGFTGLLVVWAAGASAQPWRQAYERQDYPTAAVELQRIVFEHAGPAGGRYPDAVAVQTLATLYAEGRGVAQDSLTACALSNLASGAAVYHHGERDPRTAAAQRQVDAYCRPLTAAERREAMTSEGCLQPGPAPAVLFESKTRRVEMARSRLIVVDKGVAREHALAAVIRCAQQTPFVRYVRVPAPKGSKLAARELVEVYSWHSAVRDGRVVRTLEWSAVELTPQTAALRARAVVERGEGSAWPARALPAVLAAGAAFTMHKSGDIRWKMPGRTALHGVIGRPAPLRASAGPR